jgi:WD40 repeat protein
MWSGSSDKTIRLWNIGNYQSIEKLSTLHEDAINSFLFIKKSESSKHEILSISSDGYIIVWKVTPVEKRKVSNTRKEIFNQTKEFNRDNRNSVKSFEDIEENSTKEDIQFYNSVVNLKNLKDKGNFNFDQQKAWPKVKIKKKILF